MGLPVHATAAEHSHAKQDAENASAKSDTKSNASLTAQLVDEQKKAEEKAATVKVAVKGVELVDPAKVNEKPHKGQGHLHYRVDDGPVIATTATKLSFHELASGEHKIRVMLAGNDHQPLGPEETLTVKIP